MRNRKVTGTSKRAARKMMKQAATDAGALAGADRLADVRCYLKQLATDCLSQDQMVAVECLLDGAFEGRRAAERLRAGS